MKLTAKKRWHNLLVTALADKALAPEEQDYLESLRLELGISEADSEVIKAEVLSGKSALYLKGNQEDKTEILTDLIGICLADGRIASRERRILAALTKHLGFFDKKLEELIALQRVKKSSPPVKEANPMPISNKTPDPLPDSIIHEKSGVELIKVPEVSFAFGSGTVGVVNRDAGVGPFAIGRFALTNAQWMKFEKETAYKGRVDFGERFNAPALPVVGICFADAQSYCEWAGLRLPTEPEWEYAARASTTHPYPWGGQYPDPQFCNFGKNLFDEATPATMPVGSYPPGVSAIGCHDMAGNVAEWCLPYQTGDSFRRPVRGGHWLSAVYALNVTYHDMVEKDTRNNRIGMRVATDL
ncbi:MAG: SUMF1/EgtB/PvdO family nonheme iron enzyme [Planctomycetes bacterium]|nr:SUMF1/EgtB/PvdO family nonheme iron enzyme [Planctomycetota bacterium]